MKRKRKGLIALLSVAATMALSVFAGGCDMPKSVERLICNHEYGESVITVAATCTAQGTSEKTCTLCGKVKTTTLQKLPHAEHYLSAIDPTCTDNGYTGAIVCMTCGEVLEPHEEIPALGHSYVDNACERCGEAITLAGCLITATGDYDLSLTGVIPLECLESETLLGSSTVESITVDGGNATTLSVTGEDKSVIQATNGARLTLKNLTVTDNTANTLNAWENYVWFGGILRFENCTFENAIYLTANAKAEFVNCTIKSPAENQYGAWVADGTVSFECCTFTGYRGLKIHEFEGGDDVETVCVNNCLFDQLSKKPGLAIGSITVNPLNTTICITNSKFNLCQVWDTDGSLTGVDGFYEADTPLENFNFIINNNEIVFEEKELWTKNY